MTPDIYNFTLYQSTDDGLSIIYSVDGVPFDFTGYTGEMYVRRAYGKPHIASLSATTANGKMVLGTAGQIQISYSENDTAILRGFTDGELECIYDINVTSPTGVTSRILMGDLTVSEDV